MDIFYCCGTLTGAKGYRRHADENHNGDSPCVLWMTRDDAHAIIAGRKTISDLLVRKEENRAAEYAAAHLPAVLREFAEFATTKKES